MGRRAPLAFLVLLFLLGIVSAAAWAATINGSSKNDTLRGTAKADKIFGKGGNDRLYGLGGNDVLNGGPGNDLLVGGPGADRFICGPGRDTVNGDSKDTASRDCEVVKGIVKPKPPTPPTPPPTTTSEPTTTTTAPPPPPTVSVLPGRYCGFTNQGQSICFTVDASGRSFSDAHFGALPNCRPAEPRWVFTLDFGGDVLINADGSFAYDVTAGDLTGSYVHGIINSSGSANGTMHLNALAFDYQGEGHFDCDVVDTSWSATKQG